MEREATPEELAAIEEARGLARAGVPIFVCPPNPFKPGKFFFKAGWQHTEADPATLDDWQPGWGVGAVGGGACDFLDLDPRSGSDESQRILKQEGAWPLTFGTQSSPSGGTHYIISRTGERKETGFLPGIDFQAGSDTPDESGSHGRAFVWLAPTVGRSKVTGELVPYRWVDQPDLDALDEWRRPDGTSSDTSTEGVVARVHSHRARNSTAKAARQEVLADMSPDAGGSQLFGGSHSAREVRAFTREEAMAFTAPSLQALREAKVGWIEERGMDATLALEHFVPSHLSVNQAYSIILDALSNTAYDPNGPSDWTADKFLARLDGRRPAVGSWRATLAAEWPAPPAPATGRLRRAMLRRSEVDALPDPVPLIDHILFRGGIHLLSGKFGTYKSFVAIGWACSLATGRDWFGYAVPEAVPVIYAAAEGAHGLKRRIRAWEAANGPVPDNFYLIPVSARLTDGGDMRELGELIAETGAKALVFDTFHASTPGIDGDKNGDVGRVYDVMRTMRDEHDVAIILPHHTGHAGERARGGSAMEDDADVSFLLSLKGEDRSAASIRTLVHRKTKDEGLQPEIDLRLELIEGTGSGHVVRLDDAWKDAAAKPEELGQEQRVQAPEAWTWTLVPHNSSHNTRRILQVLRDVAGEVGITEAKVQRIVLDTWYSGNPIKTKRKGHLSSDTWSGSWTDACDLIGQGGEKAVVSVGSGRWALNPAAIPPEET